MRFLSTAPFDRFSLAMHPSGENFLKALFLRGARRAAGCLAAAGAAPKGQILHSCVMGAALF